MKKKRMVYTILFCVWIGLNYFGIFENSAQDMAESLVLGEPPLFLSTFQSWFFTIVSIVFDSICIAVATGIFAYHYRELRTWHYLALALFVRYFPIVFFLPFAIWDHSLSEVLESARELGPTYELVILSMIQLSFVIVATFVGISYGRDADCLDRKDEELGYIGGVSKKLWAVLMLFFNPVARFSTELSLVILYRFSKDVSSKQYWSDTWDNLFWGAEDSTGGIISLMIKLIGVWMIWCLTFFIFYYGILTVRHKEANHRLLKILAIFVALPATIVVIPLIRNRTWFF